jgi:LCP family protein required for cell wall assembly
MSPRLLLAISCFLIAGAAVASCADTNPQATQSFQTKVAASVLATLSPIATPAGPSATPVATTTPEPTETAIPTKQPSLTASPTARDVRDPTLQVDFLTPVNTPITAVPTGVPVIKQASGVKNILLIGSDSADAGGGYRSDTMIIVSVDMSANTVKMLSIPRDLYVFIPKSTTIMGRINSVINVALGSAGGPIPLLEETILYNLGIPIHYYARVDFDSFRNIVNTLGGIDVPVTCDFQEWRLKDPADDPQVQANWELYTLKAGIQHLDGDMALWYARGRQVGRSGSGSDFDRHRRQQEVLRAMFHQAKAQNLLPQIPALYQQIVQSVDTDMTLGDMLQFMQLGLSLDELSVRSYSLRSPYVIGWVTPNDKAQVLLPVPDEFYKFIKRVMSEGGANRLGQSPFSVEVWNGWNWDQAAQLAAYRLSVDPDSNLAVSVGTPDRNDYTTTTIIDYTVSPKGSPLEHLKKVLHVAAANVISAPDPNAPVQFRVILGADYNSCAYQVAAVVTMTPAPDGSAPTATAQP